MNWEAIGALGEWVAAVAVVISIAYLAIQVRSNTKAVRGTANFDAAHSWAQSSEMFAQVVLTDEAYQRGEESRLVGITAKAYDPDADPSELTASDHLALGFIFRGLFQKLEGQYYLYKQGFLETDLWEVRRDWARGLLDLPIAKAWWEVERTQSLYTAEFMASLEAGSPASLTAPAKNLSRDEDQTAT